MSPPSVGPIDRTPRPTGAGANDTPATPSANHPRAQPTVTEPDARLPRRVGLPNDGAAVQVAASKNTGGGQTSITVMIIALADMKRGKTAEQAAGDNHIKDPRDIEFLKTQVGRTGPGMLTEAVETLRFSRNNGHESR